MLRLITLHKKIQVQAGILSMALWLGMGGSEDQADDCLGRRQDPSSIWKLWRDSWPYTRITSQYSFVPWIFSKRPLIKLKTGTGLSALLPSTPTSTLPPKSLVVSSWWCCPSKSLQSEQGRFLRKGRFCPHLKQRFPVLLAWVPLLPLYLILCPFDSRVQPSCPQDAVCRAKQ